MEKTRNRNLFEKIESLLRVAVVSCFNSTWTEPGAWPIPHPCPSSCLNQSCHRLTAPSESPKVPATAPAPQSWGQSCLPSDAHHEDHIYLPGAPGLRGCHQPPNQPGALCCLPVHVLLLWPWWCGFEELFFKVFSSPVSWGQGTCWETDEAAGPTRWPNLPSGYQETRLWWLEEWVECNGVCVTLGKKCESVTTGLVQTGHWKKWPSFVWLHWDSLPGQAGEIHQRVRWPCNQLGVRLGAPGCGIAERPFDQHALGDSKELSLRLPSCSHGNEFLVTKAVCACWSYLHLFYNLYQIIFMSFICTIPSN